MLTLVTPYIIAFNANIPAVLRAAFPTPMFPASRKIAVAGIIVARANFRAKPTHLNPAAGTRVSLKLISVRVVAVTHAAQVTAAIETIIHLAEGLSVVGAARLTRHAPAVDAVAVRTPVYQVTAVHARPQVERNFPERLLWIPSVSNELIQFCQTLRVHVAPRETQFVET